MKNNQTCQIYDQCAANGIICGGGTCSVNSTSSDSSPTCYCKSPLTLIQLSTGKYDCICSSDTHYYNGGVCTVRPSSGQGTCSFIFSGSIE